MFRTNGGLIGKYRPPTIGAAPGIWSPAEQIAAKHGQIWASNDLYSDKISLLLHMNGFNNSRDFIDSSARSRSITVFGNAKISTEQSKFQIYNSSGKFELTSGDYLQTTISEIIGTGPYTIEGFFYTTEVNPLYRTLISLSDGLTVYFHQGAIVGSGGGMPSSDLRSKQGRYGSLPALSINTWHHWAITRTSGGVVNVFANGIPGGINLGNGSAQTGNTFNSNGLTVRIGANSNSTPSEFFNGYKSSYRITRDVARYTDTFTPPNVPFPS